MSHNSKDPVVVIGGGPAGSTAATLIASAGQRVLLLERDRFPRFHIGESLIPETYGVLERLGMLPKMKGSHFIKKYSVQFVGASGRLSEPFYFVDHKPHPSSQTWQVRRSEFDHMLLENAREHGVEAREGVRVLEVLFEGARAVGVRIQDADGVEQHGAGVGRGRRQRAKFDDHESAGPARVGSAAQKGGAVDLLEGSLSRHGARRRGDDRAAD